MSENNNQVNPRVFISYSWDSPDHKLWVESLAQELRKAGIDARLDAWRDESQSIDDFMMIELERADYVIAVCTPQFKQKIVENAEGVAGTASGFEIGTAAALRRSSGKDVIPILRAGAWLESAPSFLVSYRYYDFTSDDIGEEFAQLRDRLLGHVRRPPELGKASGPAAGPELPDIFARGSQPKAATGGAQPASAHAEQARSAPTTSNEAHPASTPVKAPKGYGKFWLGAGAAVAVLVLLIALIPTEEDTSGTTQAEPQAFVPQESDHVDSTGDVASGNEDSEIPEETEFVAREQAETIPNENADAQWGLVSDQSGCSIVKQPAEKTWLFLTYDAGSDELVLIAFDPAWEEIEQGKLYPIILEMDEDPSLNYPHDAYGIWDDGVPGVRVLLQSEEFLLGLAQRHFLGFFWDEGPDEPYQDYWVMDVELSGSYAAVQQLIDCAEQFTAQ